MGVLEKVLQMNVFLYRQTRLGTGIAVPHRHPEEDRHWCSWASQTPPQNLGLKVKL